MATKEAPIDTETIPFAEQVKAWRDEANAARKNTHQTEIRGFKLIANLIAENFTEQDYKLLYQIDNEAIISAVERIYDNINTKLLAGDWIDSNPIGLLGIYRPQQVETPINIDIEFRRGVKEKEWDGLDIAFVYNARFSPNPGGSRKISGESIKHSIDYVNGYKSGNQAVYELHSANGTQLANILNQSDTLTKLEFVSELLSQAFSRNPTKLER